MPEFDTGRRERIWFDTVFEIRRDPGEAIDRNSSKYRGIIGDYLNEIHRAQPEIDFPAGEVIVSRNDVFILSSGGKMMEKPENREVRKVADTVRAMAPFDEITVVFSHIEEAAQIVGSEYTGFNFVDARVVDRGFLRDWMDKMEREGRIDITIPANTLLEQ